MLKEKEFKELIGFGHTKLIIGYILVTGLGFPYLFLTERMGSSGFHPVKDTLGIFIGLIYAALVAIGNIYIFYYLKTNPKTAALQRTPKQMLRDLSYYLSFTLIMSTFMLAVPLRLTSDCGLSTGEVIRNIIGACLLVSILTGFYEAAYYMNALKKSIKEQEQLKRENVESQLEILKNQVKPHFLFNSLNTLASLIPEDASLAVDYVHNLSKVYRYVLEIKDKKLIPVAEELSCVKAYLFMLQIRFGNNLNYEIEESGLVDKHHIVPLSLQLLVENAVKHNIISSKKPLTIIIAPKGNKLTVTNNLQPKIQVAKSTGTGLANIKSRYQILTNLPVEIIKSDHQFSVELPIIDVQ